MPSSLSVAPPGRSLDALAKQAEWRTDGIEPHDARFDASGRLLVANGGILRAAGDKKRDLDDMNSSLVRLDIASREKLGQWRVPDRRLSLRHPAIAADAPLLAVLDGERLEIATRSPIGKGYCGDIAPGPNGGFYLNGERAHRVLRWDPDQPAELQVIAELERGGALASWGPEGGNGVVIGGLRGIARWHPARSPEMLRWPIALALDNHWAAVRAGRP